MVPRRHRLGLVLGTALTLLLASSTTTAPAQAQVNQRQSTRTAVAWGPTSWVGGAGGYAITGTLAGPARKVRLEYKVAGGWRPLDATRSRKHSFGLTGSWDWYGAHVVRLRTDRAKGRPAKVVGKQVFTVATDYPVRGQAAEFVPFAQKKRIYRFNPCQTIRWRFNSGGGAGDPLLPQVQAAITLISRASGIPFRYAGTSTAVPLNNDRFEKGTDLVVAFAHDADIPTMDGATARGGPTTLAPGKGRGPRSVKIAKAGVTVSIETLFSGYYSLDQVSTSPTALLVFMHELGHAMGLDHVMTPGSDVEVMYSGTTYIAPWPDGQHYPAWGAGDLAGLSRAGAASGCLR